jgi:dTDP-4-amino-4,6-dideoxygalactose transaminase
MKMPIIKPNVDRYADELMEDIRNILQSNMLTNVNIYTKKFEDAIAKYLGVKNAVALSACTSGLILGLDAMGVRGKEVILPSFTFVSTPAATYWTNNKIVYADIDWSFTLDVEKVQEMITPKTGAILAVHMYGNPANIKALTELSEDHNIKLFFDAAHALGSKYHGKRIGSFGNAEVFSLSPTKLLTSVEGGMLTTQDDELASKIRVLRNYGMHPDYTSDMPGLNARLSEVHAAIGLAQVKDLDTFIRNRDHYVNLYKSYLGDLKGIRYQDIPSGHNSAHKDFSIIIDPDAFGMNRDELGKRLEEKGIGVKKYFYPPMHRLKAYRDKKAKLPLTDYISDNVLSLPIYNFMDEGDIKAITDTIKG